MITGKVHPTRPIHRSQALLGAGPVYLRRLADGQLWRADITITAL